ncbi:MAG: DUF305 domain-containing protein [Synechococcaceae cyanobacterium SM2_3_1]|nr:DUF305 domain-containing protein [Synechococcaceae cyanobacterium SM2_3_1]
MNRLVLLITIAGSLATAILLSTQLPPSLSQSNSSNGMDHGVGHTSMTMSLGPADTEFDLRFLDGMTLHHQGAVVMSEQILQNSQRSELKQFAQDIITAQQAEIKDMQMWRERWYPNAPTLPQAWNSEMGHMIFMSEEMKTAMRMDIPLGNLDQQFDLRFLDAMIVHHEGALVMAKEGLENSQRPEIQQLGREILATQQEEIEVMKQWRTKWYS